MLKNKMLILILILLANNILAGTTISQKTKKQLLSRVGKITHIKPTSITKSPISGLYVIMFGAQLIYVSEDGRYIFDNPPLIDLKTRINISEKIISKARKQIINKVNPKTTIVYRPTGKTKHIITVFTDIECPYCQKLHNERKLLLSNNVEIHYVFYPRAGANSQSYKTATMVWCAKNKQQAMTKAKKIASFNMKALRNNMKLKPQIVSKKCKTPIIDHMKLLHKLNLEVATPQIVLQTGEVIRGYLPPKKLLDAITKK